MADGSGEAAAATTISVDSNVVVVTNATNGNDRLYLPSPTACPTGHVLLISAAEAFELSSKGDGATATTINGTDVTDAAGAYARELDVAANALLLCVKTGANAWSVATWAINTPN